MSKEISLATVQQHNKANDLWMVIDNKVYDVTKFRDENALIDVAGRDATKDFNDVGHSAEAREMLKKYFVGNLAASDIKKKPTPVREIGLAIAAIALGITVVYMVKRHLVASRPY